MTTMQLKQMLIEKINEVEDIQLLEEMYRYLELNSETGGKIIISGGFKQAIDEALEQIERGDYLTSEEANKEIEEWLQKL